MFFNKLGHQIFLDCIKSDLDMKTIEKIISEDETELPAGYPRLWFAVYGNSIKIMNLRSKVLKEYQII